MYVLFTIATKVNVMKNDQMNIHTKKFAGGFDDIQYDFTSL
jgi:hypothetical protein